MSYLLRQARQPIWNGEALVSADRREQALASFARRPEDTDGVSVYAITNDTEEKLVVAAIACKKMEGPNKLDMLHLQDAEVRRFGPVKSCKGETPVHRANLLHCTLDWEPQTVTQFVDYLLAERRKSIRYSSRDV